MKVRVWSDLHFEINGRPAIINETIDNGELLVLAGDIWCARYFEERRTDGDARSHKKALKYMCDVIFPKFEKIVYVMGNHEHYWYDINESAKMIREAVRNNYQGDNFHLLENEILSFKDYEIYGCTLWTAMTGPMDKTYAGMGMNDYKTIGNGIYTLTPDDTQTIFNNSLQSMKEWMGANPDKKKIIVTHHAPALRSLNPKHTGNGLDGAFASSLEDVMYTYKPLLWIHGHTHGAFDYMVDQTRVYANQYGYRVMGEKPPFTKNTDIEV